MVLDDSSHERRVVGCAGFAVVLFVNALCVRAVVNRCAHSPFDLACRIKDPHTAPDVVVRRWVVRGCSLLVRVR